MENEKQYMSRLDRNSHYRITALQCAVQRAGQDGGLNNETVDVLAFAEIYYGWLTGKAETEKPVLEKIKKKIT
jgi:hypothetical protein